MVTDAHNGQTAQARDAAAAAAMTAAGAARTALQAARAAFAGLAGMQAYNPVAYAQAQNRLADAMAAYERAKAASDAAAAATTAAEAERQQGIAEAAQGDAEMANMEAMVFVQQVKDVPVARTAAQAAVTAAKMAYDAAMEALAAVEAQKADDMDSYDMAKAQVDAAMEAYEAAMAAAAKADAATTSAAAKTAQAEAEAARDDARTAEVDAKKYAAMVTDSHGEAEQLRMALGAARDAAADAATAAMEARDAAQTAVDALEDKKADDVPNYTRAMDQLTLAKAAYDAAKAASDAAAAAMATADGVDEARRQQGIAEAEQAKAEAANVQAMRFAELVVASYNAAEQVRMAAAEETRKLAAARTAAATAATDARTAAGEARAAAEKVKELLGADSQAYMDADEAATAAEEAATAAETASANAAADTMSADAEAEQATAEGKKDEAQMKLAAAEDLARQAGVTVAGLNQLRIENAQDAAETAKDAAKTHATSARGKATMAREQATAARAAADMAMLAKTDYVEADKKAMEAEMAADDAKAAAEAAEAAAEAAETAYMEAMADDVTATEARAARDEAQKQQGIAMASDTGDDGANANYMVAKMAAMDASTASMTHVFELLKYATGQSLDTADARKARAKMVAGWVAGTVNADGDDTDTVRYFASEGNVLTVTPAFHISAAVADADTNTAVHGLSRLNLADGGTIDATELKGAIVVHPIGEDRVYHFGTGDTTNLMTGDGADDDVKQMALPMLGDFTGVELSKGVMYAHIYTDYDTSKRKAKRGAMSVSAVSATASQLSGQFAYVAADRTLTATTGEMAGAFTKDGVKYTTDVVLSCAATADCSVSHSGEVGTATVTSLGSGWKVTGTSPSADEMGDPDYLTFGIWLDNSPGANDGDPSTMRVGAFASGNMAFGVSDIDHDGDADTAAVNNISALTGKATYMGSATGLHSYSGAKNMVNPFDAKATLTADFGAATTDDDTGGIGSISGRVHDIVSGGTMLDGDIILGKTSLGSGDDGTGAPTGTGSGATRMGEGVIDADAGTVTYPYDGNWDYRFFGAAAESDMAAKRYPGSVAGTFAVTGEDDMGTSSDMDDDVTQSFIGAFGAHREE